MTSSHRQFKLMIWVLALGYFIFYAPYSGLIKAITTGLWPGVSGPVSGFRLLPAVVLSTAIVMTSIVSLLGWWKYAGRHQLFGLSIPVPRRLVFLSGLGTAIIIGTTTLAFTFTGVSIVFALLLMRSGVLTMAPIIDRLFKRRVRWFSWAAFAVTVPAILIAFADVNNYRLTIVAALTIAAYLSGYMLRLPCVTKLAKSTDRETTYRYFVEEQIVAMLFLVAIPAVFAIIGKGEIMMELRYGFTDFFASSITFPALLIGAFYAALYCFGTLIYLDCRENTYCIPLNRGSSLLAGFFASYVLTLFFGQEPPSTAQLGSAALLIMALMLLSPFHHSLERAFDKFSHSLAGAYTTLVSVAANLRRKPVDPLRAPSLSGDKPPRVFLFVCSGNTCRSPMAAAICNAEIAARFKIPLEALDTVNVRAISAGVTAKLGAPMTLEAQQVLRSLNVPVGHHAARNLTVELAHQAEMIFCMTSAHRKAVIEMIPSVAGKTLCLNTEGDIDDPIGAGAEVYSRCANLIQSLIRLRLDQAGVFA